MEDITGTPVWTQLGLFEGGYEEAILEFTVHLVGQRDDAQVNVVIKETYTRSWIGAMVPTHWLELRDEAAVGKFFVDFINGAREQLKPF